MIEHREIAVAESKSVQWIAVPKVFGAGERAQAYAAHLFTATADTSPRNCGYIVDVRGNTGGNVWPMLTGLSGLLGDGPAGRETKPDGSVAIYAELKDGAAVIVEEGEFKGREIIRSAAWRSVPALTTAPVAVLTDDSTASSGEGVVVAFRGRANTRTFGQPTVGVSTANDGFELSDGVNLVVTVGVMTDRNGVAYPQGLAPDQPVAFTPAAGGHEDSQIEAAKAWLTDQPGCAAAS
ncbi:Peptidase family S41 [compost metagenome]